MAHVTVVLPPLLAEPDSFLSAIQQGARAAMDAEIPSVLTEIAQEGRIPRDRGTLQRAVVNAAQPARIDGSRVVADITVAGEASQYAAVQDLGRRAGKRMTWRVLYYGPGTFGLRDGWRSGWVNRKLRPWVQEIAASLRAEDEAKRVRGQAKARLKKDRVLAYERRACYLLAVSIASKIRARGMVGKMFIEGQRDRIAERVAALVESEIGRVIRELGVGG